MQLENSHIPFFLDPKDQTVQNLLFLPAFVCRENISVFQQNLSLPIWIGVEEKTLGLSNKNYCNSRRMQRDIKSFWMRSQEA